MSLNVCFYVSSTLCVPPYFACALQAVKPFFTSDIAPLFGKDWQHCAVNSFYISCDKTVLEPLETPGDPSYFANTPPPSPTPKSPPVMPKPERPPSSPHSSFLPCSPRSRASSSLSSLPQLSAHFASFGLNNDNIAGSTRVPKDVLSTSILELLGALRVTSDVIAKVEHIYNNVGHAQQELELQKCGFNNGTCSCAHLLWG